MAVNSLNDYSTTVANNLDIAGTSIAVGCAPADVGVFMRTVMAQIAYAVQGSGGTIPATWNVGTLNATTVTTTNFSVTTFTPTNINTVTLTATGLITPSSTVGIKGTATNDSAQAASIGEVLTASGGPIALTNAVAQDLCVVTLTAGDWDVRGAFSFDLGGGTTTTLAGGISLVVNTFPAFGDNNLFSQSNTGWIPSTNQTMIVGPTRISIAVGTNIHLVALVDFIGSLQGTGKITARRVR
jgi:hypothetical protein